MSDTVPNPFAVPVRRRRSHTMMASRILVATKGLAMVAALFGFLAVAQTQSRRWLLERWASGLSELPATEQVQRLLQIDALGDIGTETVARRLAAEDDSVAATAYELLLAHQNQWAMRDDAAVGRAHLNMIRGINEVASSLSGQRVRWATELLNQSLVECVERSVRDMDDAYSAANLTLAKLPGRSLVDDRSNLAADESLSFTRPTLVPLPVRTPLAEEIATLPLQKLEPIVEIPLAVSAKPTVAPVQTVARITTLVEAKPEIINDHETLRDSLQSPRHLTQTSYQAFDTKSVIGLLSSRQAETRDQAVEELVRRGMNNEEIRVANQLASPMVEVRLGLLDSIVHRTDLDPRPWMLWLAEDPSPEVRMRAISGLATMKDAAVKQALRKRLPHEHDPAVITHLNRAIR